MSRAGAVLAVVGLRREARIAAPARALVGGGQAAKLAADLESELAKGVDGVISFGLCGALAPGLKPGDLVLGESVIFAGERFDADRDWTARLASKLPGARIGPLAHAQGPVATPSDKAALRTTTDAIAVDMESGLAARLAFANDIPFVALRAVSDAADRALAPAAQVGLGPDGRPALGAVMASLIAQPSQIAALIRTALEAEAAFRNLAAARRRLAADFARLSASPARIGVSADRPAGASPPP
ncbi:MAG: hypothetical protein ACREEW_07525 [Caulobacteraceae bacterium]